MTASLQSATVAPGRFGPYGGRYVPETLMVPLFELERAYESAKPQQQELPLSLSDGIGVAEPAPSVPVQKPQ